MTTKLKKELAQQRRGGSFVTEQSHDSSATTEAVDQVEQTTGAAIYESGHRVKRGIFRAVTKAKKERQKMKVRQNRPEVPEPPSQMPPSATPQQTSASHSGLQVSGGRALNTTGPKTYISGSPTAPKVRDTPTAVASPEIKAWPSCKADTATVSVAPSPGNRMLQQAMDHRRELARHQERPGTTPAGIGQPIQGHYGKSTTVPDIPTAPKENLSPKNQSINPSIKECPRRSFRLKEKPPGGAFTPRTRPRVEQAVRNAAAPATGKHAAANLITSKARQKAQREVQRNNFRGQSKQRKPPPIYLKKR